MKTTRSARSLRRATLLSLLTWVWGPTPAAAQNMGDPPSNPTIVYATNTDGGVSEINAANNSVIATAPFGGVGAAAAVTPDGRRIYVTDYLSANVTVFDAATNAPIVQIPVGSGTGNIGVAVMPDGSAVYVTSQFDGIATVIATATNSVVKTIATGAEPIWVTISPDGYALAKVYDAQGTRLFSLERNSRSPFVNQDARVATAVAKEITKRLLKAPAHLPSQSAKPPNPSNGSRMGLKFIRGEVHYERH